MTTDDDTMVGVGVGVGVGDCVGDGDVGGDESPPPQAVADSRSSNVIARRSGNMRSSRARVTVVHLT
jgi:hypothetical protein